MGFLQRLFGTASTESREAPASDSIQVFDAKGQKYHIERSEYRETVLPKQLEKAGQEPDKLYDAILMAMRDKFFEAAFDAAQRLAQLAPDAEGSAVVLWACPDFVDTFVMLLASSPRSVARRQRG